MDLRGNGRVTPQKVSRRRCRSECLATVPSLGLQVERCNLRHNTEHYAMKSAQQNVRNSYTIKPSHQLKVPEYYNNDAVKVLNAAQTITTRMKDTMMNGCYKETHISDLKDVYLQEMEEYKERVMELRDRYSVERELKDTTIGGLNPRTTVFDTNRRKLRARSESEPHELYTSATASSSNTNGLPISRSMSGHRGDDVSLKRSREAISPPLDTKLTNRSNSSSIYRTSKEAILQTQRLKSKSPVIGLRKTKLRPTTPVRRQSPLLRKSLTPTRTIIKDDNNKKPSSASSTTALAGDLDEEDAASVNSVNGCSKDPTEDGDSLEDDDDDLPLGSVDDDFDGSLTDPEDNYKSHLAESAVIEKDAPIPDPEIQTLPAPFAPSLFPNCPPYITFSTHQEKGPVMPPVVQKILKWKLTTITPVIVRRVLFNSGFRLLRKTNDWCGTWAKHMKSPCFKTLKSYQKFNHLPGSFQIGRKDRVWRNLQNQMIKHGKKEFGFMPRTFVIPHDLKTLRQVWPRYAQRNVKWIIKPPASARGTGIKVVNQWAQIPKRKPLIVQRYIERPLLINGSKFDLRLYVLVTSINPLRVYMHTDGLARFASVKYSEKADTLNDRYMHLTNYSINKLSSNYAKNEDANACQGHKWTIKSLWSYLADQGYNVSMLWSALKNLVLRTILAGEGPINAMSKVNVQNRYNCFELFGIDVILDSELVPWLLEVNISPSLHSASPLDAHVKGPLVTSLLNTCMYQVPPKIPMDQQLEILEELGLKSKQLCFDKRVYCTGLNKAERQKHSQFSLKDMQRKEYLSSILENLTPDDIRCLLVSEDEFARSSPLERIFPTTKSHHYLTFTDCPRYYNRLLDAWEARYHHRRQDGIDLLRSFCEKNVHLDVPPQTFQKDSSDNNPVVENGFTVEENQSTSNDNESCPSNTESSSTTTLTPETTATESNASPTALEIANVNSSSLANTATTALTLENNTPTLQETSTTSLSPSPSSSSSSLLSAPTSELGDDVPMPTTKFQNNTFGGNTLLSNSTKLAIVENNKNGLCAPPSPTQISDQENNIGMVNGGGVMNTGKTSGSHKIITDSLDKKFTVAEEPNSSDSNLIFVNQ